MYLFTIILISLFYQKVFLKMFKKFDKLHWNEIIVLNIVWLLEGTDFARHIITGPPQIFGRCGVSVHHWYFHFQFQIRIVCLFQHVHLNVKKILGNNSNIDHNWKKKELEMVFCYQNCEKKKYLMIKNLRLKVENFQIFWDH